MIAGSGVGARATADASTARWIPHLGNTRRADFPQGEGFHDELLLRVEYAPGGKTRSPRQVDGSAATRLPAGRVVARRRLRFTNGRPVELDVVEVGRRWVLDEVLSGRRAARIDLPGFRAGGRIILLEVEADTAPRRPPDVLPGAVVLGSALDAVHPDSVDCTGGPPTGNSEPCTVVQTRLRGRPLVPRRSGVIRRWIVRGARGDLALQVLRRRGKRFFLVARTQYVHVPDEGLHVETANLPVRPGDLVGLEVTPGAAVGVDRGSGDAQTARWFGPVVFSVRQPEQTTGSGFDRGSRAPRPPTPPRVA